MNATKIFLGSLSILYVHYALHCINRISNPNMSISIDKLQHIMFYK